MLVKRVLKMRMASSTARLVVVALCVHVGSVFAGGGKFTFYNIMPYSEGREEESARDMVEYVNRTGNPICLYSLSVHAEGRPAMTRALRLVESYRKVRRLVEGTPVRLGVLLQSTLGHWSRVDREIEPWQRTVRIDGSEGRFCPLDPGFQAYIREVVRLLAEEKPVMMMGDDDIRGYSGGMMECFCPLHMAAFNDANGTHFTSGQLREAVKNGKEGDPTLEAFVKLHRKTVCDFAALIRESIDGVDPSIPGAACMPGMAWELKWSPLTARALAAKGQEPILSMANSQYGEILNNFCALTPRTLRTMAYFSLHEGFPCLLDESDSFPHNQWSKSGVTLHSKLVSSIFLGARGSKIWFVNGHKDAGFPVSRVYADVLARFRNFYPALAGAVEGTDLDGVISPAHPRFPLGASALCDIGGMADGIFGTMGIPYRCGIHLDRDGAYVLSGEKAVDGFSDAELNQLLSYRVLVDGDAAVALTARGFSGKTGVSAAFDPSLKFKQDYFDVGGFPMYYTSVRKPAVRLDCAAGAEEFSHLVFVDPATGKRDPVTPSGVRFVNSEGGTVVTVGYSPQQYWPYLRSEQRRDYFHYALGLLGRDAIGYALMNPQPAQCLVRRGAGADLVAVFNFCPDPLRGVLLKCPEAPKAVKRLGDDGTWLPLAVRAAGADVYEIDDETPCCGASVYRIEKAGGSTVLASSFGWKAEDATKCLQSAIDSGASKVVVDRQASEWLVETIRVPSDKELVFADGVVVRAKPGSMAGKAECLFRVQNASNVVIRGEGRARLVMNRSDYLDPSRYRHSEHRHLLSLRGVDNVTVRNLSLEESGGDGVYLLKARHVVLDGLVCRGHSRQGTSIIDGGDIQIRNCVFSETKGALPECGMDIEPSLSTFSVGKVVVDNCLFCSNNCSGLAINVSHLKRKCGEMDVAYRNCKFFDNAQRGIWTIFSNGVGEPVRGRVTFEDCEARGNRAGPLQVANLESDALVVKFERCRFDASGMARGRTPIVISNGGVKSDLNNLSFVGCSLTCPKGMKAVSFGAMTGCGVLPGGAKGVLDIAYTDGTKGSYDFSELERKHVPNPELRKFETGVLEIGKLVAASEHRALPCEVGIPAGYRGPFTFLQSVLGPGSYPIRFQSRPLGKKRGVAVQVEVFDPAGTPHDTFTVSEPDFVYQLKTTARAGTIYRFEVRPCGSRVVLSSETAGQGFVATGRIHWLTGKGEDIYFQARPGAGDVKVELTTAPHEPVTAELIAPDGTVADKCVKTDSGVILCGKRAPGAPAEIWRLHVTRMVDDCHIRLGAATTGVYAYAPEMVLVERK